MINTNERDWDTHGAEVRIGIDLGLGAHALETVLPIDLGTGAHALEPCYPSTWAQEHMI
jgi:hypothetical protein